MSKKHSAEDEKQIFGSITTISSKKVRKEPVLDTDSLPVLPTRNLILFPGISIPITIGRESSLEVAKAASEQNLLVGIVCQKDEDIESPAITDLYQYGTVAEIIDIIDIPDGNKVAITNALHRIRITGAGVKKDVPGGLSAKVEILEDKPAAISEKSLNTLLKEIEKSAVKAITGGMPERKKEYEFAIKNMGGDTDTEIAFLCTHLPFDNEQKIELLKENDLTKRIELLYRLLVEQEEKMSLTEEIKERAREMMTGQQRNAFLSFQMDVIRNELYGEEDAEAEMNERAEEAGLSGKVLEHFQKESRRLGRLNPQSPDYAVLETYLDTLLALPWKEPESKFVAFADATRILERDHFGLEKVKERIIEQVALMVHNPSGRAPIICLVGPPGVGKTSLGESIARAMGREYQRISFGGLHDEAEIRGHRRTYIGAMPGRIIDAMKKCDTRNPVLLLDEIDKIGKDYKGDPAAALLEVLDPEQNKTFHDNYIDVDFDLSKVLFICTANTTSTIPAPLLDRMEVIEIPGYLHEEKIEIARRHLIPRALARMNMEGLVRFRKDAISKVISSYTAESGVRQLEKELASIIRKVLVHKMKNYDQPSAVSAYTVTPQKVTELLGTEKYVREEYNSDAKPGIVPGLAWTSVGGEMLYIEALLIPGNGEKITLTGNLGDVMKESATIAWQLVRAHAEELGIAKERLSGYNLHIHAPEGAVPKDGPSAGITIATAITSAYLDRSIVPGIAMTGEITLSGKVLPVGGIREKILAAKRAGINTIILSVENKRHIQEIQEEYREGMSFIYVKNFKDVLAAVLPHRHS